MLRKRVRLWSGLLLTVTGVGSLSLVVLVGFGRANELLGVPAAVASLAGLVLSAYGVAAPPTSGQVVEDSEVGGSTMMIGRARSVRIGRVTLMAGASEHGTERGRQEPAAQQIIRRSKISGDSTMMGDVADDVEI